MILFGKVKKEICDGYERYVNIEFEKPIGTLWCYVLAEEYEESSFKQFKSEETKNVNVKLSIEWVNSYKIVDINEKIGYKQIIDKSSHIEVIGIVRQVIDEYTIICDIGELADITVEFESEIHKIDLGNVIALSGNLKAEFT